MKRIFILLVVLLIGGLVYWFFIRSNDHQDGPKQQALKVARHSAQFNKGIDSFMDYYFSVKNSLVEADSVLAIEKGKQLVSFAGHLQLTDLKKDTAGIFESASGLLNDIKSNAESMIQQPNLTEMRKDFRMINENIYPFLKTIHYEGKKLYWQNCPMAFGEGKEANWISNTEEIVNPYLGKKHPEYKATMLGCGEIKDSIMAK